MVVAAFPKHLLPYVTQRRTSQIDVNMHLNTTNLKMFTGCLDRRSVCPILDEVSPDDKFQIVCTRSRLVRDAKISKFGERKYIYVKKKEK